MGSLVDGTFATSSWPLRASNTQMSVNVPPTSTATTFCLILLPSLGPLQQRGSVLLFPGPLNLNIPWLILGEARLGDFPLSGHRQLDHLHARSRWSASWSALIDCSGVCSRLGFGIGGCI